MKYIKTKILCYTEKYNTLTNELNEKLDEKDAQREAVERMNIEYKIDKYSDLELDIKLLNEKLENEKEFRDGFLYLRPDILTVHATGKPNELLIELGVNNIYIQETLESFEEKKLNAKTF